MSATRNLIAEERNAASKSGIKKLRSEGKVPAIVYGNGKPEVSISVDEKELISTYKKGGFFSKTVEINVGKEKIQALPQDVQFHPIKEHPLHVDFLRIDEKSRLKIAVPVEFTGKERSPGLKRGGVLNTVRSTIEVYCTMSTIPEKFFADLSELQIGDNVKYSDIDVPESVEPVIDDRDFTVATIAGRIAKEEEVVEETASDEESDEDSDEEGDEESGEDNKDSDE